ncbi:hypothetical protein [Nostoc sp.]
MSKKGKKTEVGCWLFLDCESMTGIPAEECPNLESCKNNALHSQNRWCFLPYQKWIPEIDQLFEISTLKVSRKESDKKYTIFLHGGDIPIIQLQELSLVAKVNLNDFPEVEDDEDLQQFLNVVYSITQNRESFWCKRPEIEMLVNEPQRSTAIGDIFELDKHFWMVAPFGFVEIYPQKK